MPEHVIDLDDADLAAAAAFLKTDTPAETVRAALVEVAKLAKRVDAMRKLAARGAAGQFDELLDKRNQRR